MCGGLHPSGKYAGMRSSEAFIAGSHMLILNGIIECIHECFLSGERNMSCCSYTIISGQIKKVAKILFSCICYFSARTCH